MKLKMLLLLMAVCLLLTGCNWFDGSYVNVTPYREQSDSAQMEAVSAANYAQLRSVVEELVASGTESSVINVADYDQDAAEDNMKMVVQHILENYPIGAYAVEDVTYEVGASSGKPAIAVNISYRHSRMEIQKIQTVQTMEEAEAVIGEALKDIEANVVLQVASFAETDFAQVVQGYAEEHPEVVMEIPQVTAGVYGGGTVRVVELTFTYQTSRDSLRSMQSQVEPVFASAALYVSGEGADVQKYSQLYAFLMERFDYKLDTSITPAYSLLRHGVGDSRAFATVYASMCRRAGLECMTVTGTRYGEPWTWNIVLDDENYFHVDLLRCSEIGKFLEFTDSQMPGYVWDYSAYPACPDPYVPPTEEPTTQPTETTQEETAEAEETAPETEPEAISSEAQTDALSETESSGE